MNIADAPEVRRSMHFRCPECWGRLIAHKKSIPGGRAHFEHHHDHGGCSRAGKFGGTPRRHPEPLLR